MKGGLKGIVKRMVGGGTKEGSSAPSAEAQPKETATVVVEQAVNAAEQPKAKTASRKFGGWAKWNPRDLSERQLAGIVVVRRRAPAKGKPAESPHVASQRSFLFGDMEVI